MFKHKKLFSLLIILFSFVLLGASCSNKASKPNSSNNSGEKKKTTKEEKEIEIGEKDREAEIGEEVANKYLSVQLQKLKKADKYKINGAVFQSNSDKDLILAKVKIKNTSDTKISTRRDDWSIVSSQYDEPYYFEMLQEVGEVGGTTVEEIKENQLKYTFSPSYSDINSGESISGWMQVEVPKGMNNFAVKYNFLITDADLDGDGSTEPLSRIHEKINIESAVWKSPKIDVQKEANLNSN